MGVWPAPWTQQIMVEANRFWLYSLLFSIVLGVIQLFEKSRAVSDKKRDGERRPSDGERGARVGRGVVVRRLLTDGFDLLIPGSVTGWIPNSPATVGFASMVSTLLASKEIWDRLKDK